MLLRLLLEDVQPDDLFLDVIGKAERLPVKRYAQAVAVALALRHSWERDDLLRFSKRLGVKVTSKDLTAASTDTAADADAATASPSHPRKTRTRA